MKLGSKQASKLDPQHMLKRETRKNKQGIAVYIQQRKVGKEGSLDSPILSCLWCAAVVRRQVWNEDLWIFICRQDHTRTSEGSFEVSLTSICLAHCFLAATSMHDTTATLHCTAPTVIPLHTQEMLRAPTRRSATCQQL